MIGSSDIYQFKLNRIEVINHLNEERDFGRAFTRWLDRDILVEIHLQDDGRTLKMFLAEVPEEKNE